MSWRLPTAASAWPRCRTCGHECPTPPSSPSHPTLKTCMHALTCYGWAAVANVFPLLLHGVPQAELPTCHLHVCTSGCSTQACIDERICVRMCHVGHSASLVQSGPSSELCVILWSCTAHGADTFSHVCLCYCCRTGMKRARRLSSGCLHSSLFSRS